MAEAIPSPRGLPILGNALDIDAEYPMTSLNNLADRYGEIFKLSLGGHERVFICSNELLNEVMDERRFEKAVTGALVHIRSAVHDGLFTAFPGEHNWEVAHRALMPAFGPVPINAMFDEMHDIATQLILKWARYGPDHEIKVSDDFTRLTLDSIALCAMGTRFNSFYTEEMHPFVKAMVGVLVGAGERARRPAFAPGYLYRAADQRFQENVDLLAKVATNLVRDRRQNPTDKKDLLNAMLHNKDPKTGEHLTEETITNNMITFLIAGHETTSGLLSFLFYELLKNPEAYRKAQAEVDEVVGEGPVTVQHLSKLKYINAVMRETLRLHPTAPAFTVRAKQDEIIGGKYRVTKDMPLVCFLMAAHRDHAVYGEDAERFEPERMLDEPFGQLPPNAWKPFGNGTRGCIGRQFAWQEALLAVAMVLQNFDLSLVDPTYKLQIQSTLTIKPKGFSMRAKVRHPDFEARLAGIPSTSSKADSHTQHSGPKPAAELAQSNRPTLSIFYGSNAGTCEAMANSLASSAGAHGFQAQVDVLDKATNAVPLSGPVVIITSSYEGEPPDNAAHFVSWLKSLQGAKLDGVKYAVFGCGNRDWQQTYHKIPKFVDTTLAERGAERLVPRGAADANDAALFDTYDTWKDEQLWPAITKAFGAQTSASSKVPEASGLDVKVSVETRASLLRQDLQTAMVLETALLTDPEVPQKRHMEIQLPSGMTYRAGDYLAVLPFNPLRNVRRAMARFNLPWDAVITISPDSHTTLPKGKPVSLFEVLSALVELSQPATSKQVKQVAETVAEPDLAPRLQKLAGDDFKSEVVDRNLSLLDLLEEYPTAQFSLGQFLDALPAMRIRQYSISSSPLKDPSRCTITYTVVDAPSRGSSAGRRGRFLGVSSNYLRSREPGDWIHVAVRPSHAGFHLPLDDSTPVLMVCAGTGLAPFRAFVQERALKIESGRQLGPALLFYGCGSPSQDDIYAEEFARWQQQGAVDVRRAYSRHPDQSFGCRHVQDRIWHDRDEARSLFVQDARVYMCGAGAVGAEINKVMAQIYIEAKGVSQEEADDWVARLKGVRYWADVFA
ncbi:bifunctional P-450:NADPH-P450 reductase [Capronia epimyces CBS 606.96]|uniref:Bifunctional cytochrome P450/NADPH--P450 reductase n=1 Tax=Capronia epimyces CBS 606.96 TaxID=1182542 RepID=W9YCK7_9EURO|nr:bifunctional P-450:NADPH-P450 reductase [Capronia epimyces CBS 606.96]EXJ86976.1 bifunctional P-450:NADPH-P450 reductase [Capronia epimyces CBS 606.96]